MRRLRSLFWWHRTAGLLAALFVVFLAITGVLLNHVDDWRLNERRLGLATLANWYGVEVPPVQGPYRAAGQSVALLPPRLYVGEHAVAGDYQSLHGVTEVDGLVIAAVDGSVLLIDPTDGAADRLPLPTTGAQIHRLALSQDQGVQVATRNGRIYQLADGFDDWHLLPIKEAFADSAQEPVPGGDVFRRRYLADSLNWERVLADLHSGRALGVSGAMVMDLAAVAMVFLASTGLMLWSRRRPHQRRRQVRSQRSLGRGSAKRLP